MPTAAEITACRPPTRTRRSLSWGWGVFRFRVGPVCEAARSSRHAGDGCPARRVCGTSGFRHRDAWPERSRLSDRLEQLARAALRRAYVSSAPTPVAAPGTMRRRSPRRPPPLTLAADGVPVRRFTRRPTRRRGQRSRACPRSPPPGRVGCRGSVPQSCHPSRVRHHDVDARKQGGVRGGSRRRAHCRARRKGAHRDPERRSRPTRTSRSARASTVGRMRSAGSMFCVPYVTCTTVRRIQVGPPSEDARAGILRQVARRTRAARMHSTKVE